MIFGCTAALAVVCMTPPAAAVTLGLASLIVRGITRRAAAVEAC